MRAIDIHFHVVPSLFIEAVRNDELRDVLTISREGPVERFDFHAPPGVATEPDTGLQAEMYDDRLILGAIERRGLSAAVVSSAPEMFMPWAAPALEEKVADTMNRGLADLSARHPYRIYGLASLPLHSGAAAAATLEHSVRALGLKGAAICTHRNGVDLDNANLDPLFAMAERLDVPLFLHPQNSGDLGRMHDYHLWNVVGFPFETALAASRLLLAGVFERHPQLKVILAHGGGYLPYQLGRLDHAWRGRRALREQLPQPPSAYLKNMYCDSLVHDPTALRFLIERWGADHVVVGSDYPFGMGSEKPVDEVLSLGLTADSQTTILSGTLSRLLRLSDPVGRGPGSAPFAPLSATQSFRGHP